jgi:multicomponent Na+:H+ antiporter subunit C
MTVSLALLVAALYACGTYLLLQRTLTRIIFGLALLGHGSVVLLQTVGGRAGRPPLVGPGDPVEGIAAPLPQALGLTAIVISFAMTAFLLALAYRSWVGTGSDDVQDDLEDRRIARMIANQEGHFGDRDSGDESDEIPDQLEGPLRPRGPGR